MVNRKRKSSVAQKNKRNKKEYMKNSNIKLQTNRKSKKRKLISMISYQNR